MQERIAEEMLHLARNLKENIKASGHIVREDNEVIFCLFNAIFLVFSLPSFCCQVFLTLIYVSSLPQSARVNCMFF